MSRTFVLGANVWFVTMHDSKGDGLMRLAGHIQDRHWTVSSQPCDC